MAVGEGRWLESGNLLPVPIRVGDRVIFSKYAGSEITIQGETMLLLNTADVQGVYNWLPAPEVETIDQSAAFSEAFDGPAQEIVTSPEDSVPRGTLIEGEK